MLSFPNAKINLGLNIIRKREDGYHDLETVFYPVEFKDALEGIQLGVGSRESGVGSLESGAGSGEPGVAFSSSGLTVSGDIKDNLCVKAWELLKKDFPDLPGLQMHLHKIIPMGAGLGGGSADGAFALMMINRLCKLQLSEQQLANYALQLGSDCPFFISNQPCFAGSRGEKLQPVAIDLSGHHFVIVNPGIHISTANAFSQITPRKPERSIIDIIKLPIAQWKELLVNDFEESAGNMHPEITNIKKELYNHGAVYASMTGSGSSVFGIFKGQPIPGFQFNPNWQAYPIK
jgi:4-diphosphocytidyl-2-C-methyl-D-erythritol kinase